MAILGISRHVWLVEWCGKSFERYADKTRGNHKQHHMNTKNIFGSDLEKYWLKIRQIRGPSLKKKIHEKHKISFFAKPQKNAMQPITEHIDIA